MSKMEFYRRENGFELTGSLKFKDYSEIEAFCDQIMRYPKLVVVHPGSELMVQDAPQIGSPLVIDDEGD
jgi:hypothetical protein